MDGFLFVFALAASFGLFLAAFRTGQNSPHNALVFAVLAAGAGTVCLLGVIADSDGVAFKFSDETTYRHRLASDLGPAPLERPQFDWTFDGLTSVPSPWKQLSATRLITPTDKLTVDQVPGRGGVLHYVGDDPSSVRSFGGGAGIQLARPLGQDWDRVEFDYRVMGDAGRYGLKIRFSCDVCSGFVDRVDYPAATSAADSGWLHTSIDIPIDAKHIVLAFGSPFVGRQGGLYSTFDLQLDNVHVYTTGNAVVPSSNTSVIADHGLTSAGRWVLVSDSTESTFVLVDPTAQNRTVFGGLLLGWAAYCGLYGVGVLPALLSARRRV